MKVRCCAPVVLLPIILLLAKSVHFALKGRILSMVIASLQNNARQYDLVIHVRKLIFPLRLILLATVFLMLSVSINAQPDTLLIAQHIKAGSYYLLKPESKKDDMDSADYFFNQALALSRSIGSTKWINTALVWKGNYFIEANNMDSGRFYFQKAIHGYHTKNYLVEEAAAWLQWGTCTPPFNSHFAPEKAKYFEHAYQLYWKLGDSMNALESLKAAADAHLYARPEFRAGLARLSALGLSLDAWQFHPQLPGTIALARACPQASIVLCHCGGPLGYGPYAGKKDDVFKAWRADIVELAKCENVTVKLGGMMMRLAAFDYGAAAAPPSSTELAGYWGPYIETCIEHFGANRCLFESNYPVEKMGIGYAALWNAFKRITAGASREEKAALYSGTARRVYHLA